MKLTWHPNARQWTKVIGKRLGRDGSKLTQAQFYFGENREQAEAEAASRKAEWSRMKRTWKTSHRPFLATLNLPFADTPHWYRQGSVSGHGEKITPEDVAALEVEAERGFIKDVAYEHRDTTLAEATAMFLQHRRQREGVDFKPPTNKSFEIDLRAAMRAADGSIRVAELTAANIDDIRAKLVKGCKSRTTAANYGNALKYMLRWYWSSALFVGGAVPFGVEAVFAKFPRRQKAKPKHLTDNELKLVFAEATSVRRLYLLLMLNTGMLPTDIASVQADAFDLKAGIVTWKRQKNDRLDKPSEVVVQSHLWPETVESVRKFLADDGPAFRTKDGKPLAHQTASRNRANAVAKSLQDLFDRLAEMKDGIEVSAKNFRQTGAQKVLEASDYETSRAWLGRGFASVDQSYLTAIHAKINVASIAVREKLIAGGIL